MKLFKLFALSLVASPSVALGMESAQPLPVKPISKELEKACYSSSTGEPNLNFLLFQFFSFIPKSFFSSQVDAKSEVPVDTKSQALDANVASWYCRPRVQYGLLAGAAAALSLAGYYYRNSVAELIQNPAPVLEKITSLWSAPKPVAQPSLWAGIKSLFSR